MDRIISVSQIKTFLHAAFSAGFEANKKWYNDELDWWKQHYQKDVEFVGKMTMKK